ncbi:PTS system D-mannitol-specific IIA component (Fru family) /PTS system D-mannitol-specific IIB component (Fru family) /PTS system D-mannitol-specific IIC component (Fru family)|uniref:PTS system mannitol-specific EIICBA component n=1 Tax=Brenneria salicis ATCC 15712 = DSM 30166 TaxID=714314 RepID=A0A366I8P6_9GAMM|nr:PTS mannitol transporter subunit IICBA [Brenneria salicis]NMN90025.1 PTS system D-mannitol-specific IIA component (Fru family) /PTS system D-mannitol-specific IIB component (Fru family) /PTS system D-mannitol-specific IIC component (Fru family) [Brenneria salicis ATCC 15712 = DSM 30166]RBP64326.1 PTS system D-mannitol-specific IIA component (Fru family) /PTS system D-mannitol-specific IIB component (Fru family) /PTS system D-mannitol-specific IIC component (Fru family) [Brenneria salicis ATCC 
MLSPDFKVKVQNFGRFLSNMVMPNIGAFIAWGIITALFIPTGWIPNETLAKLVGPMITYLLPLLIGYTGGRLVFGERGGVVGAITTMGVIAGTDIPMFLGAMIVGPLGGWTIKRFDKMVDGKIKSGFEMLVNNFSAGIIGMLLAILAFLAIGPLVEIFSQALAAGVNVMVQNNLLPFTSIFVEPAKILFLNNAINHGIFSPLGIQQATETGKSIFFLIEANPGPGMGVLMAYMFFGRGNAKESAPGAAIIHFLGGIHEIYFPYVLMNPRLIIAVILGGMTGVFTLGILDGGLVSPASPGSILAVLAMTPKGAYFANIVAITAAFAVSFLVSVILLKSMKQKNEEDLSEATRRMQDMKATAKGQSGASTGVSGDMSTVRKIIVACDAGMGSSAMGAGVLRKKVQDAGLTNISVTNSAINNLPDDVDLVIAHRDLTERAMRHAPQAQHISLTNFLDSNLYNDLAARLVASQGKDDAPSAAPVAAAPTTEPSNLFQLSAGNIFLNQQAANKEQAIRFAGEQLVKGGYVDPEYVDAMLEREKLTSTYLGESIAVPHGTIEAKDRVLKTGVVFCQYPDGVRFGDEDDEVARLVIGIAARNNEHIQVITSLTNALDDDAVIERLARTQDVQEVLDLLSGKKNA